MAVPTQHMTIQLGFFLLIVCKIFLSSLILRNTSSFSNVRSKWSSPFFTSITFQTFQAFLTYFPKCQSFSNIERKLCSKCSTLLVSSLNLSPVGWWKYSPSCWILHSQWQFWNCHGSSENAILSKDNACHYKSMIVSVLITHSIKGRYFPRSHKSVCAEMKQRAFVSLKWRTLLDVSKFNGRAIRHQRHTHRVLHL